MSSKKYVLAFDPGRKNLAMCLLETETTRIMKWTVHAIDLTPRSIATIVRDLDVPEGTIAVIERQPHKNPSMKKLEAHLEMACAYRDIPVRVIDPKLKLSFAMSTPWWPTRDIPTWSYTQRKKLAVETVDAMLRVDARQSPDIVDTFMKSKKKDDLADAFLHAAAFARLPDAPVAPKPTRRIKPVKPTPKHVDTGKYTQGNLAFLASTVKSFDDFHAKAEHVKGFAASCCAHFDTLENAYVQLGRPM